MARLVWGSNREVKMDIFEKSFLTVSNGMVLLAVSFVLVMVNGYSTTLASESNEISDADMVWRGISARCPRLARMAIENFKKDERIINRQSLIPSFEEMWLTEFDPVSRFYSNPTNVGAFYDAYMHAMNFREYGVARTVVNMTPESLSRENPGIKEAFGASLDAAERREIGYVSFSNNMVKVFQHFPDITNIFFNPLGTFCVEWEEALDYKNKLHLVNRTSGQRFPLLKNVADGNVFWSTNGRYLIIQWRKSKNMIETDVINPVEVNGIRNSDSKILVRDKRCWMSVVDTEMPDVVLSLEDYLPEIVRLSADRIYQIREWTVDCGFRVYVQWHADSVVSNELMDVCFDGKEKLKVKARSCQ